MLKASAGRRPHLSRDRAPPPPAAPASAWPLGPRPRGARCGAPPRGAGLRGRRVVAEQRFSSAQRAARRGWGDGAGARVLPAQHRRFQRRVLHMLRGAGERAGSTLKHKPVASRPAAARGHPCSACCCRRIMADVAMRLGPLYGSADLAVGGGRSGHRALQSLAAEAL